MGKEDIIIRPFHEADVPFMLYGHKKIYRDEYAYGEAFYTYAKQGILDFVKKTKREREDIWIAECKGQPAGMLALVSTEDEGTAQLRWFIVEKTFRKNGVGRRLMETLLAKSGEWGYTHILLWSASNLTDALRFYSRYGFVETERTLNTAWADDPLYEVCMDLYK